MSVEEIHQVRDHLAVLRLGCRANTGSGTQLDVVVKTGTLVHAGDLAVTGQIGEDAAKHIQCLVDGPGRGIGTEVTRAVLHHLPRHSDFGEWVCPMDLDVWIALVILEADVVLWAMFLDEVHLKDERLKFGPDHDPLDVCDLTHKPPRFRVVAGIRVKI